MVYRRRRFSILSAFWPGHHSSWISSRLSGQRFVQRCSGKRHQSELSDALLMDVCVCFLLTCLSSRLKPVLVSSVCWLTDCCLTNLSHCVFNWVDLWSDFHFELRAIFIWLSTVVICYQCRLTSEVFTWLSSVFRASQNFYTEYDIVIFRHIFPNRKSDRWHWRILIAFSLRDFD